MQLPAASAGAPPPYGLRPLQAPAHPPQVYHQQQLQQQHVMYVRPPPPQQMRNLKPAGSSAAWESADNTVAAVYPHVLISPAGPARNGPALRELGVTHVLNMAAEVPDVPAAGRNGRPLRVLRGNLQDNPFEELLRFIPVGVTFIEEARRTRGRALVHCAAGVSRSGAMMIAYAMYHEGLRVDAALARVRQYRPGVDPYNFMHQLREFEGQLERRGHYAYRQTCTARRIAFVPPPLMPGGGGSKSCCAVM